MKHFASLLACLPIQEVHREKKLSNFLPIDFIILNALPFIMCNHFRRVLFNFMHVYILTNKKPALKTFNIAHYYALFIHIVRYNYL